MRALVRTILAPSTLFAAAILSAGASSADGALVAPAVDPSTLVCKAPPVGGHERAIEQNLVAVQSELRALLANEMKPGMGGVQVDSDTIVLNGRGHNYAPVRARD